MSRIVRLKSVKYATAIMLSLCGVCASAAGSSDVVMAQAKEMRDLALEQNIAYKTVESLTTEIGPRLAGSAQEARARDWAVAYLNSLDLDNVRVEPFELPGWVRGEEYASVTAPFPQPLSITALGGSVATPASGIEKEVVLFENLAALQQAEAGSLKNKIAYVGHAMQRTQDGSSYGYYGKLRRIGASVAAEKGAAGILIRSIGTDSHRMPHTGQMNYAPDVTKIPAAALSNPDADQLERIAERGKTIKVKMVLTPKAIGAVKSGNVIAEIEGSEHPEQVVVIGGHLDSWDLGTGAVDDGAGVAITTAAMELIKASGLKPKRTIRLILWGSEEVGLLGGKAYLQQHQEDLANHVIGTESDFGAGKIWQITSRVNEAAQPYVADIASLVDPLGIAMGAKDVNGGGPDLTPMVQAGFPGFRFVQNGTDYFDLHHTHDDTLDKIDPKDLDQSVAAYVVFAWIAANADVSGWGWEQR